MPRKKYRGVAREIAELNHGDTVKLEKPADLTNVEFGRRVSNAVDHFGRTRARKLRTKMDMITGTITVRRVHTDDELTDMGF
jgi:hypothetical protein